MSDPNSKFPINRIVAFAGPYISVLSGALADWAFVHLHFLSLFHTTNTAAAKTITQLGVFGLTSLLVWLSHQKWLTGWQAWEMANTHAKLYPMVDESDTQNAPISDADEFSDLPPESSTVPDGAVPDVTGVPDQGETPAK